MPRNQAHVGTRESAEVLPPCADFVSRWGLQLRLLAAVLAQHFHDAHLRSKVSWLQGVAKQETVEQLSVATLTVRAPAVVAVVAWSCTRSNSRSSAWFGVPPLGATGWYGHG